QRDMDEGISVLDKRPPHPSPLLLLGRRGRKIEKYHHLFDSFFAGFGLSSIPSIHQNLMNRFIPKNHRLVAILCILVLVGFFRPAKADLALFKFTGTGINGSVAWGSFTVADTALVPNYYANGNIYPSLSMTVSNIPGAGPGFVVFSLEEINSSSFTVD